MLKLYYSPGACSIAAHIVLEEIGVAFEAVRVTVADGEHLKPEYLAISPRGRVPVLDVDGEVISEVPALLAFLAALEPGAALLPEPGTIAYGRCFELMAFLSSSLHIAYAQLWRPERFVSPDSPARGPLTGEAKPRVRRFNEEIESRLTSAWVLGRDYSIADAYLFPFYRWGVRIGLPMTVECPQWTAWKDRMIERPAVRRAIEREGIGFAWAAV